MKNLISTKKDRRIGIIAVGILITLGLSLYLLGNNKTSDSAKNTKHYELEECYLGITIGDLSNSTRILGFSKGGFNEVFNFTDNMKVDDVIIDNKNIIITSGDAEHIFVIKDQCDTPVVSLLTKDEEKVIKK